jgi:hypothetical protein
MLSQGQRYFFDVRGTDKNFVDRSGTSLQSDSAAMEYAASIVSELKKSGHYDGQDYIVIVRYLGGEVAFSIPF